MNEKEPEEKKSFSEAEKEVLEYWQKNQIFEKSLAATKKGRPFVFFEGPPYANGRPGIHHALARAYKDIILRFKTMRGFYVRRKAGWDTHGLPTEMEVERKLGISAKKEIEEKIGLERFVEEAKKSVFSYKEEWERLTRRMAYWLDLENPYITMTNNYIESLWWVFSQIAENGFLYKDYKVLPWCPRCGTSLSSHELAQGYKKVKDESVYVKFKLKAKGEKRETLGEVYFLAWTTTPWTLPGNVALAVNPKISYATVEKNGDRLILAKDRLVVLGGDYKEISEERGSALVGLEYEPLYGASKSYKLTANNYTVVASDFVTAEDGTGILHVAPAFGREDQEIGKKEGLPTLVTVDEEGKMKTPGYDWDKKYFKEANPLISEYLKKRGLLFKTELYEHDYPFCWRCRSPLIYFAKNSWFLKTTAVKNQMIAENKKIGWHPEFIKKGRFGEWLAENVDWAISRERYWGTPLPIWQCAKCQSQKIIGSLEELDKLAPRRSTKIFVMRHGEADHNVKGIIGPATPERDYDNHLTKKGIKQVEKAAKKLKKEKIDLIISSPLNRALQTAEILSKNLGVKTEINTNIYDIDAGDFHGRSVQEEHKEFPFERKLREPFPNGESLRDVRARMMMELRRVAKNNRGKNIIVVSHGDPIWMLNAALEGLLEKDYQTSWYPKTGEAKELKLHNWPYNRAGELDLHRPYIDLIDLQCPKCAGSMKRVKEVADVWFDSGCVPFAQDHYPFEKKTAFRYPADYIAEGIDQTRGWFYTLLAVASLLKKRAPYKNVLTLGLVLDEKGEKMSKSRGNAVEPLPLFERYGADAVRWYFYTINQPWDEKLFKESDVADASRRFLNIFWNSFVYWQTYKISSKLKAPPAGRAGKSVKSKLLINKWVWSRLNQVGYGVTEALENFDIVRAARMIENFVAEDLSRWYIRRVRDLMRFGSKSEKEEISGIFGSILFEAAKISAPFIPFLAERMNLELMETKKSVHLEKWTGFKKPSRSDLKLIEEMNETRRIVSAALEARAKAGLKVRQPLASLKVRNTKSEIRNNKELQNLVKGEVNIKEIKFDPKIKNEVELDINITPELKEEGQLRELIRHIQEKRKEAGLKPSDKIIFVALTDNKGVVFVRKFEAVLKKEAGIKKIDFDEKSGTSDLIIVLKFNV